MKYLLALLAATGAGTRPSAAQGLAPADTAAQVTAVVAIEQQLSDGIVSGDTATWNKYLTGDFLLMSEDGSRNSKRGLVATMKPLPKGYSGTIRVTQPRVRFRGDVAVLNYVSDEHEYVFGQHIHTTYGVQSAYVRTPGPVGWRAFSMLVFEIPQLPPTPVAVPAAVLQRYVGTYRLAPGKEWTLTQRGGHLYAQRSGGQPEEWFAETETMFFRKADTRGRKIFTTGPAGRPVLIERRNGQDVTWQKR